MKKDLEKVKEYYKDIFPEEVNEVLEGMIKEEVEKQKKEINKLKTEVQRVYEVKKINYNDIFLFVRTKLV